MTDKQPMATPMTFEEKALASHQELMARIDGMSEEEKTAWSEFGMPGYLDRLKEFHPNRISSVAGFETDLGNCVDHWRGRQWQESKEHELLLNVLWKLPTKEDRDIRYRMIKLRYYRQRGWT